MQAWYNCRASLGPLSWKGSCASWGLYQDKLGLSAVCVMEVLKPEDRVTLLLPKNHCHLKYKLSDLLWDLCTVSRRNQYVQRTISCLHLRNFLWLPTPEMCGFPHWLQRQFLTSKPLHVCGGGDCLDTSRGKCATGHVSCKPSTSVNAYTHVKHKQKSFWSMFSQCKG